jgi:diadenosine tetraphosphatase ApaH/serine/threonine PP2A family protein phosphatase
MRYALVSDIHANWPAWCAVRDDLRAQQVDAVVCLGDVVGYGPSPQRVLADVRLCCDQLLLGNHEAAALGRLDLSIFNDGARRAAEWTATQLDDEAKTFLGQLPMVAEDEDLLFVHADPVAPEAWGYVESCKDAEACFAATTQRLIFVGHTHVPEVFAQRATGAVAQLPPATLALEAGVRYLVNVGSSGEPRDGTPQATYCIYDGAAQRLEFRRVAFDLLALRAELKLQPQLDLPWFLQEHAPAAGTAKRAYAIRVAKVATAPIRVSANRVCMQVRRTQVLPVAPAVAPTKPNPIAAAAAQRRRTIWTAAIFFISAVCLFGIAAGVYFWPTSGVPAVAVTAPAPPATAEVSAPPPPVPRVAPVIVLPATKAQLKGRQIKLEKHDNLPLYVAFWNQPSDTVSWRLLVGRAGRYIVSLVYGLDPHAGGNGFEVTCGKYKLSYTTRLKSTGSWYTFDFAMIGQLELPAGPATVVIKPLGKINGGLMNLREIRLQLDRG